MNMQQGADEIKRVTDEICDKPWFSKLYEACVLFGLQSLLSKDIQYGASSNFALFILGYAAAKNPEMEELIFKNDDNLSSLFGEDVKVVGEDENGN